jgi:hypothetical protein
MCCINYNSIFKHANVSCAFLKRRKPHLVEGILVLHKIPIMHNNFKQLKKTMVVASINKVGRSCCHIKAWQKKIMHDVSLNI